MSGLYETDFYAWANQQADLLREGKLPDADIGNIVEEIASLGRSERRELVSRLSVLLLHLLKWRFQPERRGTSWRMSIANTRDRLSDHLADNPSLKSKLPEAMQTAHRYARRDAVVATGLAESSFPADCPWTFDQAMQDELKAE
jgi:hypothetical protein